MLTSYLWTFLSLCVVKGTLECYRHRGVLLAGFSGLCSSITSRHHPITVLVKAVVNHLSSVFHVNKLASISHGGFVWSRVYVQHQLI